MHIIRFARVLDGKSFTIDLSHQPYAVAADSANVDSSHTFAMDMHDSLRSSFRRIPEHAHAPPSVGSAGKGMRNCEGIRKHSFNYSIRGSPHAVWITLSDLRGSLCLLLLLDELYSRRGWRVHTLSSLTWFTGMFMR
jgi:hypothetical protein